MRASRAAPRRTRPGWRARGLTHRHADTRARRAGYNPARCGSEVVAELVALARPRYHIAGGEALAYTRTPFANKDLGAGVRVTRFVGLAPQNNTSAVRRAAAAVRAVRSICPAGHHIGVRADDPARNAAVRLCACFLSRCGPAWHAQLG